MYDIKDEISGNDTDITTNETNIASTLITTKKFVVYTSIKGTQAATATNYGIVFIAPFICTVTSIKEVHGTAGADGSAVTLSVERLQGTEAVGSGDDLLGATKIDLKGTADTVQTKDLTATTAHLVLAAGDRLALKDTGTLTSLVDVCVTIELTRA